MFSCSRESTIENEQFSKLLFNINIYINLLYVVLINLRLVDLLVYKLELNLPTH